MFDGNIVQRKKRKKTHMKWQALITWYLHGVLGILEIVPDVPARLLADVTHIVN